MLLLAVTMGKKLPAAIDNSTFQQIQKPLEIEDTKRYLKSKIENYTKLAAIEETSKENVHPCEKQCRKIIYEKSLDILEKNTDTEAINAICKATTALKKEDIKKMMSIPPSTQQENASYSSQQQSLSQKGTLS